MRKAQQSFNLEKGRWGGRRKGSGRKRIHSKGVAHRKRERVISRHPLHVNFKLKTLVRNKVCLKILKRAIMNSRRMGLKVIHFSLQSNHVHLVLEAVDNTTLTRGMRSLTVTFAKGVNKGSIQLERYHLHVLKTLNEVRNAIHYVVLNREKHLNLKKAHIDEYSSLGVITDLKTLAKAVNMTVISSGSISINFLDEPVGWMTKNALAQLKC